MHDGRTFIISYANLRGRAGNAYYPLQQIVSDVETLAKVTACDHVCGSFKNDRRGKKNFISADVLAMDLDNGDGGWTTAEDVARLLPDVEFYAVPSRHHMQPKEDKPARPRFHFYFPLAVVVDDASVLAELKQRVLNRVPAFDSNAVDAARFYYGVENPTPTHFAGSYCIDELVGVPSADDGIQGNGRGVSEMAAPYGGRYDGAYQCGGNAIPEGQRNSTLYKFAVRKLKRHGESEEAKGAYLREADKCDPHLPTEELKTIWNSAVKFYRETVLKDPTYISPDRFGRDDLLSEEMRGQSLEPSDYSDVSQAMTFVKAYGDRVRFTTATGWVVFDGHVWREDSIGAQRLSQQLTGLQLKEARQRLRAAQDRKNRADEGHDDNEKNEAKALVEREKAYRDFVLRRRKTGNVAATLTEAKPHLTIGVEELDADGYLLNTPAGEVDLRTGDIRPNNPDSLCTKITGVSPGTEGAEKFDAFLNQICCGDADLKRYLQECAGMFAVGKVLRENLIIATGSGGNGKSTLFNLLLRVLGDYGGTIASDVLVTTRRNKMPEIAELRGKRLVVAAELEEGMRLDAGMVKRLASRDPVRGEKKYGVPFDFTPSHTPVLFTNFLPKVGSSDSGTWSRLVVIPFNAKFRGTGKEVLDYDGVLFQECGGAVLQWVIDGAVRFLANNGKIVQPKCVVEAVEEYRAQNDWLTNFIDENCEKGLAHKEKSGMLYTAYRRYAETNGEYIRHQADFNAALEKAGYACRRSKAGVFVHGLRLNATWGHDYSDFLPIAAGAQ